MEMEGMRPVDMHCDTISAILEARRRGEDCHLRENALHVDLKRMAESGYLLQNFALFVNVKECQANGMQSDGDTPYRWSSERAWEEVCALYRVYEEEIQCNGDLIVPVLDYEDIAVNEAAGKMSALLAVEEGAVCGGSTTKLEDLYRMGVRMMTLSWNYPNELGYPNLNPERGENFLFVPDTENGLTERGKEFVHRMGELGMIMDVSHMSDAGFYDVLENTSKPFVASHSNAREVCGCVRNLTDDMIRRLADHGGCMGLNFCADFLETKPAGQQNQGTVESVVRHARHIAKVGGIGVLGLGSDFDGIDTNAGLPGVQSMERLWDALGRSGFTQRERDLIFSGNVLRVYRDVL